ncbi:high-temperature-induced dauer-formation protein-domain-containing protein [Lasiosphaeria miniovina]|uniref:High-temperature-induced dauer-formation protein-domain-containing protein n=1 Tax=Lasiosphaeria miniovina TaxID=1954250 RepID=A0AA40B5V4_9PEZI|nr:high-temperature-induced dauer-formation protein-domain-containing protein [Lasiosphaeria miniovina]KAK0727928.1 high-temperature-induced dauer-formation protein-domain-containing protein [Lasiosphaeria miniovina]
MGASDSKLVFKKGIFRLSEERNIAPDDKYWNSFWELPESAEDIFSLFAPADVRRTRDGALENLGTLLLAVTSRLFVLRHHPSFPDPELAPEREALNCISVLTRVLPYIYEKESLQPWEETFFWSKRRKLTRNASIASEVLFDDNDGTEGQLRDPAGEWEDAKPLAEELIDTLIDLLFFSDLTVPAQPHSRPKVSYAIWQSGVGCNTSIPTTKEHESNRCEILRLLLTLAGQSLYMTPNMLPQKGTRALTYVCTCPDKQVVLSVLCSLLNTTLKYNPASWRVPYNTLVFKDPKQILVTYTLQFLLATLLYPIPEQPGVTTPKNFYRHFLGRLHRPQDFQFIVDGMTRILNQPLHANSSYIPSTHSSNKFAPEIIMLFWEVTQCNKRFRSFIVDTERAHDFVILILFYALEYKNDASKQGVVRMCAFLLQTLGVEKNFGLNLNKSFDAQDTLPHAIRIAGFKGTYADFLVQSIYSLITTSQGKLSAIYPALLAVINNIAPYFDGLSAPTCAKTMQLFNSMSSPSFLLANETNHHLLQSLLESMNSIVEHQYKRNPRFIFAILKNRKRFEALRSFTLETGQEEIERRNRRQKESGASNDPLEPSSTRSSVDSLRSPTASLSRESTLDHVPEEDGTFAIGEDDDSDDEERPTPAPSSPSENPSRASSVGDDDVPRQVRGMSEKARGKMPAGANSFSRQNSISSLGSGPASSQSQPGVFAPSAQWIDSWLPELPLHTILTLIQQLTALIPRQAAASDTVMPATLHKIQEVKLVGVDPSPIRVHSFEWSQLALGWYESLLWGFIFTSEMHVAKGTVGIWNTTSIKLFRVQETAPQGPSLTSPRGAVDAVGSNIVSRIGSINLRGATPQALAPSPAPAGRGHTLPRNA